jgi:hypothetical protein
MLADWAAGLGALVFGGDNSFDGDHAGYPCLAIEQTGVARCGGSRRAGGVGAWLVAAIMIDPSPDHLPESAVTPVDSGEIASAGRSCLALVTIIAAVALFVCVAFALRLALAG